MILVKKFGILQSIDGLNCVFRMVVVFGVIGVELMIVELFVVSGNQIEFFRL